MLLLFHFLHPRCFSNLLRRLYLLQIRWKSLESLSSRGINTMGDQEETESSLFNVINRSRIAIILLFILFRWKGIRSYPSRAWLQLSLPTSGPLFESWDLPWPWWIPKTLSNKSFFCQFSSQMCFTLVNLIHKLTNKI